MKKVLLISALCASALMANEWGYEGELGPDHWGEVSKTCAEGLNQSPINITKALPTRKENLHFTYRNKSENVVFNGHTVQANIQPGDYITLDGVKYELKQVHFHTPSENNLFGHEFPLEAHFVHADKDGHLAVVAVMFRIGHENEQFEGILENAGEEGEVNAYNGFNPKKLLPHSKRHFRFNGSLTTPPCTEGVKWVVMKKPLTISEEQKELFAEFVHEHNNRPVQPLNARVIVKR